MKVRCKYCDNYILDTDEFCSHCGAANEDLKRVGNGVPQTIEELQQWYNDHNLPPQEVTRFFIGEDYKEPRAFGIYYDQFTKNYVVYKNKDTGERAIRYEGKDQAYAVNELYLKLKEEIQNQKNRNHSTYEYIKEVPKIINNNTKHTMITIFILFIFFSIIATVIPFAIFQLKDESNHYYSGYYLYNDNYYYREGENWYHLYDEQNNLWKYESEISSELKDKASDYYITAPKTGTIDFKTSGLFFGYCKEGYLISGDRYFYVYNADLYEYRDFNWAKVKPSELESIDLELRKKCETNYVFDKKWGIQNFKESYHYIPQSGYYRVDGVYYYYYKGNWYKYDKGWVSTNRPSNDYYNYYTSYSYYSDYGVDDFYDSSYYDKPSSSSSSSSSSWSSSDWDSDSSWSSSDSWDSGSTDWGSDW